jgi:hypothetical protein
MQDKFCKEIMKPDLFSLDKKIQNLVEETCTHTI